jgi:hypothetical protein
MPKETQLDRALHELLDRQEIRDVLLRYCRGVDRRDEEILRSVYHADAVHEYGSFKLNAWEFARIIVDQIGQFSMTSHFLTNELIELEGDVAHVESYVQAVHRSEREGKKIESILALRYADRFEQREGVWKIAHRVAIHDWSREQAVEGEWPDTSTMVQGRRDRTDLTYRR